MVYELTLTSVQLKTGIFNPPAKLINNKELTCAAGMAYRKAGLPMPVSYTHLDVYKRQESEEKLWQAGGP